MGDDQTGGQTVKTVVDRLRVTCPVRLALSVCLLTLAARAGLAHADGGSTISHDIESAAVAGNQMGITSLRRVLVYMPEGYDKSRRSYPVIYWIPGWETPASREYVGSLDEAIGDGKLPPVIVVNIDVREGLVLLNSTVFGRWEDFVVDELVPFIDAEYRTIPLPQGRALMGHSTGGYGAMMLPLLHPGVWSAVGLNDASVWGGCPDEMFRGVRALGAIPDGFNLIRDFSDYATASGAAQATMQIGIVLAPNPEALLLFDLPDPEVAQMSSVWHDYCLMDPSMAPARHDALSMLSVIAVGVADRDLATNYDANISMLSAFHKAGVKATYIPTPGSHGGNRPHRFITLAREVTAAMNVGFPDPTVTTPAAWARTREAARP
ncbi:MAG: alpha/beta hydrolase-fold protein [Candidatus Poribacteria bacterium]